ncbi:hypothetical protein [Paratractidigestivibacter sp.]|uniref:hypothetical protein n=1 Tax=Paratractidigestivibacter sp. TaxID=2847316 RepID=UPI002AC9D1C5|nr:hypothetical protein [Paratractidigestivibacter sp.]
MPSTGDVALNVAPVVVAVGLALVAAGLHRSRKRYEEQSRLASRTKASKAKPPSASAPVSFSLPSIVRSSGVFANREQYQ